MSAAASQMYCTAANGGIGSSWVLRGQVEHVRSTASFTSVVSAAVTAGMAASTAQFYKHAFERARPNKRAGNPDEKATPAAARHATCHVRVRDVLHDLSTLRVEPVSAMCRSSISMLTVNSIISQSAV